MSVPFIISQLAATRYRERVKPTLSDSEAMAAIRSHARAIRAAIGFGAPFVKLGCGARLVINNATVITVLPREFWPPFPLLDRGGQP